MVIVEGDRFILKDRLVFFPDHEEISKLITQLSSRCIVAIRQTSAVLGHHPRLVESSGSQTTCVDLTKTPDAIEAAMDRKSCRYEIRKAAKLGDRVQVRRNAGPEQAREFLALYNAFVRANGHAGPLRPKRLREYQAVSDLWTVSLDGRPVCGHLLVRDEAAKRVRLVFSATTRLANEDEARASGMLNRYLHWKEIEHYQSEGFETFDLGGIGDGSSSVARFKLSFGGSILSEYNYALAWPLGAAGYRLKILLERSRAASEKRQ